MIYFNISVATYEETGDRFTLQSITNDNLPDSKPVISADENNMILVYNKAFRADYALDQSLADALYCDVEYNYLMYSVYNPATGKFGESKVVLRGIYNSVGTLTVIVPEE